MLNLHRRYFSVFVVGSDVILVYLSLDLTRYSMVSLGATRSALGPEENAEASQTSKMEFLAKILCKNSITYV